MMESMLPASLYFNISFLLQIDTCQIGLEQNKPISPQDASDSEENHFGSWFASYIQHLGYAFGNGGTSNAALAAMSLSGKPEKAIESPCEGFIYLSPHFKIFAQELAAWIVGIIIAVVTLRIVLFLVRLSQRRRAKDENSSASPPDTESNIASHVDNLGVDEIGPNETGGADLLSSGTTKPKQATPLTCLQFTPLPASDAGQEGLPLDKFMQLTVDKMMVELDRALGIGTEAPESPSSSLDVVGPMSTPRVKPRGTWRRPRRHSPSLPLGAASSSSGIGSSSECLQDRLAWCEVGKMAEQLGWPGLEETGSQSLGLQWGVLPGFLEDQCPVQPEAKAAAELMVNYTLTLLTKAVAATAPQDFRLVGLQGMGSARKGLVVGRASHFDVLMVLQPTWCTVDAVHHHATHPELNPGQYVLGVREVGGGSLSSRQRLYTKHVQVSGSFCHCLLLQPLVRAATDMVDAALQKVHTQHKLALDRLPFRISRAGGGVRGYPGGGREEAGEVLLSLDTRLLQGLGLRVGEISIRLVPALPLPQHRWSLVPTLYAVPPPLLPEPQPPGASVNPLRVWRSSSGDLNPGLLWQLSTAELEQSYLEGVGRSMRLAGVAPCHKACLRVLKALFSDTSHSAVVDRGQVKSFHLETILYFLLLESSPHQWQWSRLAERISDCVHFLRSALQSRWLPNFFLYNPHLLKQMPVLEHHPLLSQGRQENLMVDLKTEAATKMLGYVTDRLQQTGLDSLIRDEFSQDMWEYEFFIFG